MISRAQLLLTWLCLFLVTAVSPLLARTAQEAIADGLRNHLESIDLREFNIPYDQAAINQLFLDVINDHPDIFSVAKRTLFTISGSKVVSFNPEYILSQEQVQQIKPLFDERVEAIYQQLTKDDPDDLAYALRLYDLLVYHIAYTYDYQFSTPEGFPEGVGKLVYTSAGALVYGQAVCEGYSRAYKLFMDKRGIPCHILTSTAINHAWNAVQLDGKWYHVDVTWGDPKCNGHYDFSQNPPVAIQHQEDFPGRIDHSFFLLSDEAALNYPKSDRRHHDWTPELSSFGLPGENYEKAFWLKENGNSLRELVVDHQAAYYCELEIPGDTTSVPVLRRSDWSGGEVVTTDLCYLPGKWLKKVANPELGSYKFISSGILLFDQLIIFHDQRTIYGYDLTDGEFIEIATCGDAGTQFYIQTLWQTWDGKLLVHLSYDSNHVGEVIEVPELNAVHEQITAMTQSGYQMASQTPQAAQTLVADGQPLQAYFGSWLQTFYVTAEIPENQAMTFAVPATCEADADAELTLEVFDAADSEFTHPLAFVNGKLAEGLQLRYLPPGYASQQLVVRLTVTGQDGIIQVPLSAASEILREYLTFKPAPQASRSQWHLVGIPDNVTILEQPNPMPANLYTYDPMLALWGVPEAIEAGHAYWIKGEDASVTLFCSHDPTVCLFPSGWNLAAWTDDLAAQSFLWNGNTFILSEDVPAYGTPVLIYKP